MRSSASTRSNLDTILADVPIPKRFDFLSIDIDGNDYHAWNAIKHLPSPEGCVRRVQPVNPEPGPLRTAGRSHGLLQGSSPALARRTRDGEELRPRLRTTLEPHLCRLRLPRSAQPRRQLLQTLRRDMSSVTWLFSGYDGTVILDGHRALPWHGTPIKVWQLPRPLRRYPDDYTSVQHTMLRLCQ